MTPQRLIELHRYPARIRGDEVVWLIEQLGDPDLVQKFSRALQRGNPADRRLHLTHAWRQRQHSA